MRSNTHGRNSTHWKIALEDAAVTGLITLLAGLVAKGYPPSADTLYMCGLNALLIALYGWARSRGIKHE